MDQVMGRQSCVDGLEGYSDDRSVCPGIRRTGDRMSDVVDLVPIVFPVSFDVEGTGDIIDSVGKVVVKVVNPEDAELLTICMNIGILLLDYYCADSDKILATVKRSLDEKAAKEQVN